MKLKVFYDRDNKEKEIELENDSVVKDLLKKMDINPVTAIVSRNKEIIMEDEKLKDGDEIKIISTISGG